VLLKGGTVLDEGGERRADVLASGGRIVAVEESIDKPSSARLLDASGCVVAPGLVDLHTHLRQPGGEEAETVESGCRSAAVGGFTAVLAMPNTDPVVDNTSVARDVLELGRGAIAEVAVAAAITIGRAGVELVPMADLAAVGVRIFTDDGAGVQDGALLRRALEYASDLGVLLAEHCEDDSLAAGGQMHEGAWSSRLGVPGQPALAEEMMLARDLALVRLTGAPMHFLHISSAGSAELLRQAKASRLPVTAEVTPHHLTLSDADCSGYDPVFKVNPPLRGAEDVSALRRAIADGTIDAVATDHAPHPPDKKELPFEEAPPGMLGLETALSVVHSTLCQSGQMTLAEVLAAMSWRPARIARLDSRSGGRQGGPVRPSGPANLVVFDPSAVFEVDPERLVSLSRNTPFAGRKLTGMVRHTIHEGEPVVVDGVAQR
jgi:dihydroorotase